MDNNKYVAFDVHSATIVAAVHSSGGKCVMESVIETKAKTVRDFIENSRWEYESVRFRQS